ncbi:MAG: prostaglandin-endoperoxide synthase 2 [Solirubrobacteraceae bacterium]|nr:prostaglandin-endoperoxide synthase 2 [Solirubrobacteraceae bacterium]
MSMTAKRSTAKDGLGNRLQFKLLTSFGPLWHAIQRIEPLERIVNRALIDLGISKSAPRPYRLSTLADYSSIESLTDKTYNSRQLAPSASGAGPEQPDPHEVAELFRRPVRKTAGGEVEEMRPCAKSTVLFAYVAQWFTDGFLRSRRAEPDAASRFEELDPRRYRDITRCESTQEIDMTQLYGLRREQTDALRAHEGGLLLSQEIGGEEFPVFLCDAGGAIKARFASLPEPVGFRNTRLTTDQKAHLFAMGSDAGNSQIGYAMLNVLFLREHNAIAREMAAAHPRWDDERLFQTARNVVVVLLMKLVVEEYINHIAPYHFRFRLAPGDFADQPWMRPNWIAAEFNLLYRWHSLVPSTLAVGGRLLPLADTVNDPELLTRNGLGPLIDEASRQHAGEVGLFNTAAFFHRLTTLPSIVQSRVARLASYNDYRADCSLPRLTSFDQLTSSVRVREELARLYGSVDKVEFYVGIFAEDTRPNSVLPSLLGTMVGLHAFSQIMTNPLLDKAIWAHPDTLAAEGRRIVANTNSLAQLVKRNLPAGAPDCEVRLTHADWKRV